MNADGVLDTLTVILLPRVSDPACLPEPPTITAVTFAELSVDPLVARSDAEKRRVRLISNKPKRTLIRCHLMQLPRELSVRLPVISEALVVNRALVRTMR